MEENQNINDQPGLKEENSLQAQETVPVKSETASPAPGEELKVSTLPPTTNQQPQTDPMEVHKHPHHVMHKKNWSEYLLEFFMLFLAVFLGFIAENIREHVAEHEREKKFAGRLLSDLKQDSAFFQRNIQELRQRQKTQTVFFKMMSGAQKPSDSTVIIYFFALLRFWNSQFNTATYNQMKMSGSLRYIRNDELTTELQQYYDVLLPQIEREASDLRKVFTDRIAPFMIKHLKFQDLGDSVITKYAILNRTNESDQELINTMGVYGGGSDAVLELNQRHLKQAEKLIAMIKKDYHSD